jgi:ubiquinone/menaquinone biosynthesis C-methylase UbiE
MKIIFSDISQEALEKAKTGFNSFELDNEAIFIKADVHALPFEDNSADFVMSRGSIWFWKEPVKGLLEIQRILKPGKTAVVGGGLGRYIPETMRARLQKILKQGLTERNEKRPNIEEFESMLKNSGLSDYKIITDGVKDSGKWVEIKK